MNYSYSYENSFASILISVYLYLPKIYSAICLANSNFWIVIRNWNSKITFHTFYNEAIEIIITASGIINELMNCKQF